MHYFCPACGEAELVHWNMGIYECPECDAMIPIEDEEGNEDDDW